MLHLEHVGQREGEGRGGDEREEHREYGEGGDVQPDQVDDADVGRLDASVKQHAHLVRVRGLGVGTWHSSAHGKARAWPAPGEWQRGRQAGG